MEQAKQNEVYDIVTNRIIEQLKQNVVPWQKPWSVAGHPKNLISRQSYRGINSFLLASLGYSQNYFLTYKQVTSLGGSIKKDEKGHLIIFWLPADNDGATEKTESGKPVAKILRYYYVFNIAQCNGLPVEDIVVENSEPVSNISRCEEIIALMPSCPEIKHTKHEAFYNLTEDYINLPKQKSFKSAEEYYCTLFHELVHSTGHQSRLNRKTLADNPNFGSEVYSQEELVAEIGACYLASATSIDTIVFENSVSYVNGWIQQLKNNPRMILYASSYAQKAVDYILNQKYQPDTTSVEQTIIHETH